MLNIVEFGIRNNEYYCLIHFKIKQELVPNDLQNINPPDPIKNKFSHKGVILSGRGPIWFYGFLIHFYHPTKFIAIYDPRLNGAVVIESHTLEYKLGDLVPINTL
jgi:CRISPR-associated protein Csx3